MSIRSRLPAVVIAISLGASSCAPVVVSDELGGAPAVSEGSPRAPAVRPVCDDGSDPIVWEEFEASSGAWPGAWRAVGPGASWIEGGFGVLRSQGREPHRRKLMAPLADLDLDLELFLPDARARLIVGLREDDPRADRVELEVGLRRDGAARVEGVRVGVDGKRSSLGALVSERRSGAPSAWRLHVAIDGAGADARLRAAIAPAGYAPSPAREIVLGGDVAAAGSLSLGVAGAAGNASVEVAELLVCPLAR